MNKQEFITLLEKKLSGIPQEDINKTLDYYNEIILDKIDEGISEEEAVNSLGSIDEIIDQTLKEISFPKLVKEKLNLNRKLQTWEIVLICATSIFWVPLLIVLLSVILVVYICIWSGVIALGASSITCLATSLVAVLGIIDIVTLNISSGIFSIGIGLAMLGCGLLLGLLTLKLSKVIVLICKKLVLKCKSLFVKRGEKDEE